MKKLIIPLILVLFLLFSLSVTLVFISQRTTFFGRATSPGVSGEASLDNSYVFASPLSARSDGKEKVRITIFILDNQGRGVYGKPVLLVEDQRLEITPIQAVTDNLGRALYDIATTNPAEYFIEAKVDNQSLPQKVRVNFR